MAKHARLQCASGDDLPTRLRPVPSLRFLGVTLAVPSWEVR